MQHPEGISKSETEELKTVLEAFPYFQAAHAMHLKGLKNQDSYKYNQALKITAAYTTDRSILFDFITSEAFLQNEISQSIKKNQSYLHDIEVNAQDISVNKSVELDDALRNQIRETIGVLDPELFQPKPYSTQAKEEATTTPEEQETNIQSPAPTAVLNLGKPLEFDKAETHSFNEWLKLTQFKPIERIPTEDKKTQISEAELERKKKFALIDKFISNKPKIVPTEDISSSGNVAKSRMIQPEALMTETLARIYVEQKNYDKAIQSYKILSLKYPEKSGFFADQIRAIKQLQDEQNK